MATPHNVTVFDHLQLPCKLFQFQPTPHRPGYKKVVYVVFVVDFLIISNNICVSVSTLYTPFSKLYLYEMIPHTDMFGPEATGEGNVQIMVNIGQRTDVKTLVNLWYVPNLGRNLMLVSCAVEK